jgi:hypothetical protein
MNEYQIIAILALSLPATAQAASVVKPVVACKAEPDAKKILGVLAG